MLRPPRLVLDAVRPGDAGRVLEWCQDADIQRFLPVPLPYTGEDAAAFAGRYASEIAASEDTVLWAIRLAPAGDLIGALEFRDRGKQNGEIGFWLGAPHRGNGYMTEAVRAVTSWALDEGPRVVRIVWDGYVGNTGSAAVARRAGFRFEGTERSSSDHRGARVDSWRAALLAADPREEGPPWPV